MKTIFSGYIKNDEGKNQKDIFLSMSKLFYGLFLLYYGWFQMVFYNIPHMSLILGAGMIACILFHFLIHRTWILNGLTSEVVVWGMFALTSLATGVFVAVNLTYMITSIMDFIEHLIMIFGMVYISFYDNKIDYFIGNYIFFSFVCAITTIFWGVYIFSDRISMSYTMNPNALGISMVLGIFCVLYTLDFGKIKRTIFRFGLLTLFFYVMVLTGSRKSLISAVFIIVFWFVFVRKDIFMLNRKKSIMRKGILFLISVVIVYALVSFLTEASIIVRLQELFQSGDGGRLNMYKTAVNLFKKNPIFGVGFNNYRFVSGYETYSHSTYAEVLACTGILGTTLYFIPYMTQIKKTLHLIKNKEHCISKSAKLLGGLLLVLLFLGTSIIHFYGVSSSIAFGFIIAFCNLNYKY